MIEQTSQTVSPTTDYFALFERPRHLVLDTTALEKDFYRLSRQWHPDRFARASAEEKERSLEMTSQLNDAYRALKEPVSRTEYLLEIEGKPVERDKNADAKQVPPDLLEEVFELNMQLEEMRGGGDDPAVRADLEKAQKNFDGQLADAESGLQGLWQRWDAALDVNDASAKAQTLDEMVALLHRRQYVANLVRDVRAALESGAE